MFGLLYLFFLNGIIQKKYTAPCRGVEIPSKY
nr:MAG TPA: hypothetical protein [Caudoviricetes sp.]